MEWLGMGKEHRSISSEEISQEIEKMRKGRLKIYIGAAPCACKTFHMLRDAHDLKAKGFDIVIGIVETHGHPHTEREIGELEVIPKKIIHYEGRELQELDVEGIVQRNPDIVIVDELAHTNVPGSRNKKRYEDIHEILEAGIHVWTTLNIQHFENVCDIVQQVTGIQAQYMDVLIVSD